MDLVAVARRLSRKADRLAFSSPVESVYNPLSYARRPHEEYLKRYARPGIRALWVGMNPGPYGMAQTGVPFGEVEAVRGWLGIEAPVGRPPAEHPKRPVLGFQCPRREVSGRRLWGWASERFGSPAAFFEKFFIWNYCPLVFLEASGRNRTPDKLPAKERGPLFAVCDEALRSVVETLRPECVVGLGRFATDRARAACAEVGVKVGTILHPSPASPQANRGWARQAEGALEELGLLSPRKIRTSRGGSG